jgi:hypothetical protein
MRKKGEPYGWQFREQVLERIRRGERIAQLSIELGIARGILYEWRSNAEPWANGLGGSEDAVVRENRELKAHIAELEASLGQEVVEKDFFESALRRVAARGANSDANGSKTSELKSAARWNRKAN